MNTGKYSKFIVLLLGTLATGLQAEFAGAAWVPVVTVAASAVTAFLVPNTGDQS